MLEPKGKNLALSFGGSHPVFCLQWTLPETSVAATDPSREKAMEGAEGSREWMVLGRGLNQVHADPLCYRRQATSDLFASRFV